ncbi:MAG TPA: polyketide synthase, partial [Roseomonas sp.]
MSESDLDGIAIIGVAGRFPGAPDAHAFWDNLREGRDSVARFDDAALEDSFSVAERGQPNFVRARGIVEDVERFDAEFFGMRAREAALTDPQHRVFLEICWQAFEDAGYDPARYPGAVGVFAGASMNTYFLHHVAADRAVLDRFTSNYQVGEYTSLVGAIGDTLATRVSYKLDLRGPSMSLLTACSTGLVAAAQACQSLLLQQCDMALAGGVSLTVPQRRGYLAEEG